MLSDDKIIPLNLQAGDKYFRRIHLVVADPKILVAPLLLSGRLTSLHNNLLLFMSKRE